jgi:hypothetical protein
MLNFLIPAALSLGSSLLGSSSAKKAANAQVAGAKYAADLGDKQFQITREDFAPWREAGGAAVTRLADMTQPGYDHTTSPGYQFRFSEGQRAIESSAAAPSRTWRASGMASLRTTSTTTSTAPRRLPLAGSR